MAMPETIIQRWNEMTEEEREQTATFIDFLFLKRKKKQRTHFEFGALEGGLVYISDDFDEPPDEFKEYM